MVKMIKNSVSIAWFEISYKVVYEIWLQKFN